MKYAGHIAAVLVAAVLVFFVEEMISCACAAPFAMQGAVIDRTFQAAYTSLGTASDGRGHTHTTTQYHPAVYTVIVEFDGGVRAISTSAGAYARCNPGMLVDVVRRSSWTGILTTYDIQ